MNIVLFGPPGSGKGTQGDKLVKKFDLFRISSGDLLREEVRKNTNLGKEISLTLEKGNLVSDEIINKLIEIIVSNKKYHERIIFDGYPRNLSQAKNLNNLLKKNNQKISHVINLKVSKEIVIKRILGRRTCTKCGLIFNEYFKPPANAKHICGTKFLTKRSDDNEKTITYRYETYIEKTLPILSYYKKLNLLHEIDGKREINEIFKKISDIIASLEA